MMKTRRTPPFLSALHRRQTYKTPEFAIGILAPSLFSSLAVFCFPDSLSEVKGGMELLLLHSVFNVRLFLIVMWSSLAHFSIAQNLGRFLGPLS